MKVQKSSISGKNLKVKTPETFAHSNKVWRRETSTHESIFHSFQWCMYSFPSKAP